MVIHEESESPVEIAVIRKPEILEPKKYLMINNHIRELPNNGDSPSDTCASKELLPSENETRKSKNSAKKSKKRKIESEEDGSKPSQISESDLLELRTVYQNCLTVINKIESKYGHLLNIESPGSSFRSNHNADNGDEEYNTVCNCKRKKIVYDDDGQEHTQEISDHICPRMPKRFAIPVACSVTTDSEDFSLSLPDDLPSLAELLRDPNLEHRNKVIDKIRTIRQDHINELRFNRPALIQALKRDPEQVLGFTGVNLASLPGYH